MSSFKKILLTWILPLAVILTVFFGLQQWQEKRSKEINFPDLPPSLTLNFPPPVTPEFVEKIEEEQSKVLSTEKDQEILINAFKKADAKLCQKISELSLKEKCEDDLYYTLFIQSENPNQCKNLHSPLLQKNCLNAILLKKAVDGKNPKQCESMEGETEKTNCLNEVDLLLAQNQNNPQICQNLQNANEKQLCLDQMQLKTAISQNQSGSCQLIQNSTLKNQCLNTLKNNQLQVEKIQSSIAGDVNEVSPMAKCELLEKEAEKKCKDQVNFTLAFEKKDLNYCNKILEEKEKTRCRTEQQAALDQYYLKLALLSKNSKNCEMIINSELEKLCMGLEI